jgi:hypothetical protein
VLHHSLGDFSDDYSLTIEWTNDFMELMEGGATVEHNMHDAEATASTSFVHRQPCAVANVRI